VKIPKAGKSKIGSSDVIGMGKTSVAHHAASSIAIPAVCHANTVMSVGAGKITVIIKQPRPTVKPIRLGIVEKGLPVYFFITMTKLQDSFFIISESLELQFEY